MNISEFDQFADEYHQMHAQNIAVTGETPEYFARYKINILHGLVDRSKLKVDRIVDFGSGIGASIPWLHNFFPEAKIFGADVSARSLDVARSRFPQIAEYLLIGDDRILPLDTSRVDVAFSACVFHHIPHDEHVRWLRELRRVVRPGGMLCIFEHNPLNPLTIRAVNTCPFDANAVLLRAGQLAERCREAGWVAPRIRYHLFFPHALAALRPLEPYLTWLPLGAQYSVTAT